MHLISFIQAALARTWSFSSERQHACRHTYQRQRPRSGTSPFAWVNTMLRNVKNALHITYHALRPEVPAALFVPVLVPLQSSLRLGRPGAAPHPGRDGTDAAADIPARNLGCVIWGIRKADAVGPRIIASSACRQLAKHRSETVLWSTPHLHGRYWATAEGFLVRWARSRRASSRRLLRGLVQAGWLHQGQRRSRHDCARLPSPRKVPCPPRRSGCRPFGHAWESRRRRMTR